MNLKRFLAYFARTQPAVPSETSIRFAIGDQEFLSVQAVEFDVRSNAWTVRLMRASG